MKISISTIGTFHYVRLALELAQAGHDVTLFSGYPRWKLARQYPALAESTLRLVSFPWLQTFYLLCRRFGIGGTWWDRRLARFSLEAFDRFTSRSLGPCEVFIGQGRLSLHSGRRAKALGALYVCDMGSSHIRTQKALLEAEHHRRGVAFDAIDDRMVEQEEKEYQTADAISVISSFARETFVTQGVTTKKLWLNPLGVDLVQFQPEPISRQEDRLEILFVGGLALRKGIFYLLDAVQSLEIPFRLRLAGTPDVSCRDFVAAFRNTDRIEFLGHQDAAAVRRLMSESDVLVLPSIEDGFGMVLLQALACGCPIIASRHSGGPDLVDSGKNGFLVEPGNSDDLKEKLMASLQLKARPEIRQYCVESARAFCGAGGWRAYAARYASELDRALSLRGNHPS